MTGTVQSRFAETLALTLNPNPNFGESGFGESGRHRLVQVVSLLDSVHVRCRIAVCMVVYIAPCVIY